jgi:hypothetical protein
VSFEAKDASLRMLMHDIQGNTWHWKMIKVVMRTLMQKSDKKRRKRDESSTSDSESSDSEEDRKERKRRKKERRKKGAKSSSISKAERESEGPVRLSEFLKGDESDSD